MTFSSSFFDYRPHSRWLDHRPGGNCYPSTWFPRKLSAYEPAAVLYFSLSQYWRDPGAFNRAGLVSNITTDRFLGFLSVIIQAAFSFQGMELVAMWANRFRGLILRSLNIPKCRIGDGESASEYCQSRATSFLSYRCFLCKLSILSRRYLTKKNGIDVGHPHYWLARSV
jgi:hypothetical protein